MSKVYMISDPHFGHKSMSEKRGFKTVEEHDEFIINNWNSVVSKRDKIFLLGDITMEKSNYSILEKLKGSITVVLGNHDLPKHSRELLKYVDNVAGAIKYKGCILTHIPIHDSEIDRFRLNIHGHIHEEVILDYRYFNVSCEAVNYTPIAFDEIISIYSHKKAMHKMTAGGRYVYGLDPYKTEDVFSIVKRIGEGYKAEAIYKGKEYSAVVLDKEAGGVQNGKSLAYRLLKNKLHKINNNIILRR